MKITSAFRRMRRDTVEPQHPARAGKQDRDIPLSSLRPAHLLMLR